MAETKENIREDRNKRINKSKDTNNLIADNGLDSKVIDVYDILNRSFDPTIIKLRKLREYGITDEMIASAYADITNNVENKDNAIDALSTVFKKLALYISQQPNGIVIDLQTGELNKKESYRQAVRVGIAGDIYYERFEKIGKKALIEDFSKLKQTAIKENKYIVQVSKEIGKIYNTPELKKYLEEDPELLNISEEAKKILKNARKEISKEDPNLMELYKIEIEIDNASGTPMYEAMLKERERFLKSNPKYEEVAKEIRDENKNIKPDIVSKYNDYNTNVKVNCLLSQIARANDKDLNSLSSSERKALITSALAGLRFDVKQGNVRKECWNLLKALGPEITDERGLIQKDLLYPFLEKELGLEQKLDYKGFKNLLDISSEAIDKSLDLEKYKDFFKARKFILGKAKKIADKIFNKYFADPINVQEINFQEKLENIDKTPLEIYFTDSEIKFSKRDENEFNNIYQDCTVESWIDNKDKALELRYATLIRTKEKLSKMPDTKYYKEKIEEVEAAISEFKDEHSVSDYEKEDGTLRDEINAQAEDYQNKMVESALLKFYSLDMLEHNENGKSYDQLDDEHKKAYLRNIIVGLKYGEQSNNTSILKLAQRRLELLNTKDKTFISFESGNPIVSEKQILEEYTSMSKYNYHSYEELENSSEERKDLYLLKKLDEYSKLEENQFIKLDSPENKKKALEQIEKIKAASVGEKESISNKKTNSLKKNSDNINQKTEEKSEDTKSQTTNWLKKGINAFRNLFNPRLTAGSMQENDRQGFFSKIFGKPKKNNEIDLQELKQNEITNQEHKESNNRSNDWIVPGVAGKVDESKINTSGDKEQSERDEEQTGQEF